VRSRRALAGAGALTLMALSATACSAEATRLGMPEPITEQGERILTLWQGSWVAALAVGAVVWGLIIWALVFHRKRSDDLPPQVRYNLPIEMLYTAVPFIIIAVMFYFTARDQDYLQKTPEKPDVTVDVIGFQWSWQFDYLGQDAATGKQKRLFSVVGLPAAPDDNPGNKPVLVIPTGKRVQFNIKSTDVIHSFWVPSLLYKRDAIPGEPNAFQITATKTGTYEGRCSELCGLDHTRMLFQLKVVTPDEYQKFLTAHQAAGSAQ
jgi:cytochrome c oxidase subunit 2